MQTAADAADVQTLWPAVTCLAWPAWALLACLASWPAWPAWLAWPAWPAAACRHSRRQRQPRAHCVASAGFICVTLLRCPGRRALTIAQGSYGALKAAIPQQPHPVTSLSSHSPAGRPRPSSSPATERASSRPRSGTSPSRSRLAILCSRPPLTRPARWAPRPV